MLINVDGDEFNLPLVLLGSLLENGAEASAWTTPCGVEIDDNEMAGGFVNVVGSAFFEYLYA